MPLLPSGKLVGVSPDEIYDAAENGKFMNWFSVLLEIDSPESFLSLCNVKESNPVNSGKPADEIIASGISDCGFLAKDVNSDQCSWPIEDKVAFQQWLTSAPTIAWSQEQFKLFEEMIKNNETELHPSVQNLLGVDTAAEFLQVLVDDEKAE